MPNKQRFLWIICLLLTLSLLPFKTSISQPSPSIVILNPGEGSKVTSPIQFSASLTPGEDGLVRVTLIDQNGQLLVRQLTHWEASSDSQQQFSTQLVFEIPAESTQALLTLETQDKYHRPMAARGVTLTLLNRGQSEPQPAEASEPWISIASPQAYEAISGSAFIVKGTAIPITNKPIFFELISENGGLIGSKQLAVESPSESLTFAVPLTYPAITNTREVRLVIRQTIDPYGKNITLDSLPLFLTP